ncbi:MAG TPA: mechanosensitive ion channel domain-containing protein [Candidatus Baltobacteraceae bacterium]|nr:mechanosensitive ion channel domain-containing protein [Candidatus Baltobacteraceae bacterium]
MRKLYASIFLTIPCLVFPFTCEPAEKDTAPIAEQAPTAIPVAEVAARSAEVQSLLLTLAIPLTPNPELQRIIDQVPDLDQQIEAELDELELLLQHQPSLGTIAAQRQVWTERQIKASRWLSLLTQWVTDIDASVDQLQRLQAIWRETDAAAKAGKAPAAILQLISTVRAGITRTQAPFESQRKVALSLQGQVAQKVAQCDTALQQLQQSQEQAVGGTLVRESPPIWDNALWRQSGESFTSAMRETTSRRRQALRQYLGSAVGSPQLLIAMIGLWLLLWGARRQSRRRDTSSADVLIAEQVFKYPFAAMCVFLLVYISWPGTPAAAPPGLRQSFVALGLFPAIRLVRYRLSPRWAHRLYLAIAVFALDAFRQAYIGIPGLEQAVLGPELLAAILILWSSFKVGALGAISAEAGGAKRHLRSWAVILLGALGGALVSGALGYMRLSRLITSAVLGSGAWALTLYAGTGVVLGLAVVALEVWPLKHLGMVQRHRGVLVRRTRLVIGWLAFVVWALRSLDYIGLYQPAQAVVEQILTAKIERGSISLSVADVLLFAATLYATFALSKFIRFALEEDVYPHMPISRGVAYASSTLLNYAIILIGLFIAVGVLGVDLTKVTIVAGAIGVGIGLGLQGVVNNIVSGLILLFEQSIQVGDTVEVDDVAGQVARIGIRASIVRTWQGAEVVVPNSLLVAQKLTNWTLSDRRRRIDVPVNITYGTPPEKVIPLLKAVAAAHPCILADPAPEAIFNGFGDNAVNYELRAWTDRDSVWLQTRNELANAIFQALTGEGLTFALPQREVRVIGDGVAGPGVPSASHQESRPDSGTSGMHVE